MLFFKKHYRAIVAMLTAIVSLFQPIYAIGPAVSESRSVFSEELAAELSKPVHASNYDVCILLKKVTDADKKSFALSTERLNSGLTWYSAVEDFENISRDASKQEVKQKIALIRKHYYAYYGGIISDIMEDYDISEKQLVSERDILSYYNLSVSQLKKMQYDSRIDIIAKYNPDIEAVKYVSDSDQIVRSDDVRSIGYSGEGISIGVVDRNNTIWGHVGVDYDTDSPYVHSVIYTGQPLPPNSTSDYEDYIHIVKVVGVLRHVAPEANLYLARASAPNQIQSAITYLIQETGVDIISMSIGRPDLYADYHGSIENLRNIQVEYMNSLVRDANATICVATGNGCSYEIPFGTCVEPFSLAENVIGVGGVNSSNGTVPSDDAFTSIYSAIGKSYRYDEPTDYGNFVNKPDISAPAIGYTTYGFSGQNGTSLATPLVAGSIALLMDESPYLIGRQSMVKAILAAGARYKGNGAGYETDNNMCISDSEGAGVLNTYASYTIRVNGRYTMQTVLSDAEGGSYSQNINVTSSDAVIRVALSWLKKDELSNFNLRVYKGNTLVAEHKKTEDMPYENLRVIEFAPANYGYGTYTIKVEYEDLKNSTDTFSLAWY